MNEYEVCPAGLRRHRKDEIIGVLRDFKERYALPRLTLAFIGADGRMEVEHSYMTDPTHVVGYLPCDEGIVGQALYEDNAVFTSRNGSRFVHVDNRTELEIVSPIHYKGRPTGAVIVDFFQGDSFAIRGIDLLESNETKIQSFVTRFGQEFSESLDRLLPTEEQVSKLIIEIADECLIDSESVRGYIAVKETNGKLRYFPVGRNPEIFLPLTQAQGLCGEAFRKKKPIRANNVWNEKGYLPSDSKVKSEAVYPVVEREEAIAVVNMESTRAANYNSRKRWSAVETATEKVFHLAVDYRSIARVIDDTYAQYQEATVDLVEQLQMFEVSALRDGISPESVERVIAELIAAKMQYTFCADSAFVLDANERMSWPLELQFISEDVVFDELLSEQNGKYYLVAPLVVDGRHKLIVGVELSVQPSVLSLDICEQFCRVGANAIIRVRAQVRSYVFESLAVALISPNLENSLLDSIDSMLRVFEASHVTLFRVEQLGENQVLVPYISAPVVSEKTNEGFPYLAIDDDRTLSGLSSSLKKEFWIRSIYDQREIRSAVGIDRDAKWVKQAVKTESYDYRAYVGLPILGQNGELVGFLRVLYFPDSRLIPVFDDATRMRARILQHMLSGYFVEKISRTKITIENNN